MPPDLSIAEGLSKRRKSSKVNLLKRRHSVTSWALHVFDMFGKLDEHLAEYMRSVPGMNI